MIESYVRECDRYVSFISCEFLIRFTHTQYVHILTTPFATCKCINWLKNPCWERGFLSQLSKNFDFLGIRTYLSCGLKKGKLNQNITVLKVQWYANHCVKGPVIRLSLCWQPNVTHSSISRNIHKKQKSFKQVLYEIYCD